MLLSLHIKMQIYDIRYYITYRVMYFSYFLCIFSISSVHGKKYCWWRQRAFIQPWRVNLQRDLSTQAIKYFLNERLFFLLFFFPLHLLYIVQTKVFLQGHRRKSLLFFKPSCTWRENSKKLPKENNCLEKQPLLNIVGGVFLQGTFHLRNFSIELIKALFFLFYPSHFLSSTKSNWV